MLYNQSEHDLDRLGRKTGHLHHRSGALMTEARLSAGTRSLIGLGAIAVVAGAVIFAVKQTTPAEIVPFSPDPV